MKKYSIISFFTYATMIACATSSWAGGFEKGEYQRTHPQAQVPVHTSFAPADPNLY